jgi:hypothetical protein
MYENVVDLTLGVIDHAPANLAQPSVTPNSTLAIR